MKKIILKKLVTLCLMAATFKFSYGQQQNRPKLHVNPKWKECSFQIDSMLTQSEWHKFTKEAGLVAYYRPLIDAKPIGKWKFEISLMKWNTKIDDSEGAWNNTFVHPDSTHWLKDGNRLGIPGLSGRIGLTDKLDLGIFFTKNPNANYGVYTGQIQYNVINDTSKKWNASARASFTSIFGPEDLNVYIYGVDFIASKEFKIYSDWAFLSPYAGLSTHLSSARENSSKVNLKNENIIGAQAMIGLAAKISYARLGLEYNFSNTSTFSIKIGIGI